ncbi:MAG TPA: MFS transporter [Coriobacteriia bacterium]|jgi:MFS family permease
MADTPHRNGLDNVALREADTEAPRQDVVRRGGTFESFRHRDYSLFWSGALVSNVGTWMQNYALAIVVYAFRRSQTDLGIMNFAMGIPVLFLAIYAGSLADRVDRKRLIIATQAILLVQAAALGYLYVTGQLSSRTPLLSLTYVVVLVLVNGVMSALAFPSWQSILPDLVPRESLLNAIALNAAQFQSARLVGPLIAGALVLAGSGMGDIFFVNAASFLFVIAALWVVRPRKMEHHAKDESAWERITAGLRYARENRVVGIIILSTAILTIFAMPYMMLLPAFVDRTLGFHADAEIKRVVAYVMAANGLGAVVGALIIASLPKHVRRENLLRYTMLAMAVLLLAFAASRWLPVTLVLSALAGAAFITTTSLLNTSVQQTVPNRLRGRVMALFVMAFIGIMPLSAAAFGPIGQVVGPGNAIGGAAAVLLLWVIVLFARPGLLLPEHRKA